MQSVFGENSPPALKAFRLAQLPTSTRVVPTMFFALVGIGYLFALSHLHFAYNAVDGEPGAGSEDLRPSLYGKRKATLIEAKLVFATLDERWIWKPRPPMAQSGTRVAPDGA